MNRDDLEQMNRKDLIALLPDGHGFSPVSSKKADIIDAVLADDREKPAWVKPRNTTVPEAYGIIIPFEQGIYLRYTPMGGGQWRCESSTVDVDEVVSGGADVTHNGQWLLLPGLYFTTHGRGPMAMVEAYWDGDAVAPVATSDPTEVE